jgi:hypothetical protein
MRNRGPLLTLAAVVGLAMVLLGVNMASTSDSTTRPEPAAAPTTAPATATPTAAVTPTPTPTGAPSPAIAGTYAGRTAGNEAALAIAVKAGRAIAYVCDGRRAEAWLSGTVNGSKLTLRGNGGSLTGALQGNAVFGTVKLGEQAWPYSAQVARKPSGLYRANAAVRGVQRRIGWVVLQDRRQVGVQSDGATTAPAPPLDPEAGATTVDGVQVTAAPVAGDEQFGS